MSRPVIDCAHPKWTKELEAALAGGFEIDLINFHYEEHGGACEILARRFAMGLTLDRDPKQKVAHFRKEDSFGSRLPRRDPS